MLYLKAVILVVMGVSMGHGYHLVAGTDFEARAAERVVPEVSLYAAKQAFDAGSAVFLDARPRWQYEAGHIAGARSLPLSEFDQLARAVLADVPRSATLITYCVGVTCNSAHRLAQRLLDAGYEDTSLFDHGWTVWRDVGYPADPELKP